MKQDKWDKLNKELDDALDAEFGSEEPKQETLEEANQITAIKFLEWYRRKGVIYQFHAYHIQGSDDTIYLNADQLFEIFEKENYEK